MEKQIWFPLDGDTRNILPNIDGLKIRAQLVLPCGSILNEIGDIWVEFSPDRTRASVRLAFDYYSSGTTTTHVEVNLTQAKISSIRNVEGMPEYEFTERIVLPPS